jgi:cytochrome P450
MAMQMPESGSIRDPRYDAILEESFLAIRRGRDPTQYYHEMRKRNRVYFAPDRNMWVLTGSAEVDQVLRSLSAQLQFAKRMDKQRPDWRSHPANEPQARADKVSLGAAPRAARPMSPQIKIRSRHAGA